MKLIAYNSSKGGGMTGGHSSISIKYSEDGRCKVCSSIKTMHSQPTEQMTYYADGILDKLGELCERYNVINWTNLPDLDLKMYDGETSSDTFIFEDGIKINLNSGKQLPDQACQMFQELLELVNEYKDKANNIEVIQVEENMMMGMMNMSLMNNQTLKKTEVNVQNIDITKFDKFCSECGSEFNGNQKFCSECGATRKEVEE